MKFECKNCHTKYEIDNEKDLVEHSIYCQKCFNRLTPKTIKHNRGENGSSNFELMMWIFFILVIGGFMIIVYYHDNSRHNHKQSSPIKIENKL